MLVILAHAHETVVAPAARRCDLVDQERKVSATNAVLEHLTEVATHPPLFSARIMLLLLPNSIARI